MYPCKELHQIWKQWLAAYRWVYNQCVEVFNKEIKLENGLSLDQYIQKQQKYPDNQWTLGLGKTRQEAVAEAELAFKQAEKAMRAKPLKERTQVILKYRSVRANSQVIQFKNDAFKKGTWFPSKVKGLLFCSEFGYQVPQECCYGTELAYQRCQGGYRWFAIFPLREEPRENNHQSVMAFDPGVRTFLTGFDGENILEIGKGDIGRIVRLCLHLDRLISRKTQAKGKQFKKLRAALNKAIKNLRVRIQNLIKDLHRKTSALLVNNYKVIFLPTYNASEMVLKAKRKIGKKSVRAMLTWSFGKFASHLEQMAKRHGVLVIRTNEAYTSKTCPKCGHIHRKLGGAKEYKCPHCNYQLSRDWVGAINNLIKALSNVSFSLKGDHLEIACAGN